jgi:probable HAF family extracellular repeat protein
MEAYMKFCNVSHIFAIALLAGCASIGSSSQDSANPQIAAPTAIGYTVVDLGTLGGTSSAAVSINDNDWVSGFSGLSGGSPYLHATLWRTSRLSDLGTLGGPNSAVEWPVKNVRGLLAGISETSAKQRLGEVWSCAEAFFPQPPSGHICRGFVWHDAGMVALPTLGGNNGFAAGANDLGDIVGWAETRKRDATCTSPQVLQFEATLYRPKDDSVRELLPLAGDKDGAATEINDKGQVVGISGICDQAVGRYTARHAVMWENGHVVNLGTLGGVAWNTPMAINNHGEVVGFSDLSGDGSGTPNFHAFLWTKSGGMIDLGTLPGDVYSEALGINEDGQIVGASYGANFATSRAFIWENGRMTDLNKHLASRSRLYLLYANDINDRGEIAGGACELLKGACGSKAPAFLAIPKGVIGDGGQADAVRQPPALTKALRQLVRRRALFL